MYQYDPNADDTTVIDSVLRCGTCEEEITVAGSCTTCEDNTAEHTIYLQTLDEVRIALNKLADDKYDEAVALSIKVRGRASYDSYAAIHTGICQAHALICDMIDEAKGITMKRPITPRNSQQYAACADCNSPCDPCDAYTIQIDRHIYWTRSLRDVFTVCADCYIARFPWALPQRDDAPEAIDTETK